MKRKRLSHFILILVCSVLISAGVNAAEYSLKNITPDVKIALENRRARHDQIQNLLEQGLVGETNRGYLKAMEGAGADVQSVVIQENRDRKVIYDAIAEQNNLSGAMDTIEKVFAEVQRNNAGPGEKIQMEDGRWVTKE